MLLKTYSPINCQINAIVVRIMANLHTPSRLPEPIPLIHALIHPNRRN